MIEFFAVMFLIGLSGFIIFAILTMLFKHEITMHLFFVCFLVILAAVIGIEVEKAKEPDVCECKCCSVCNTET